VTLKDQHIAIAGAGIIGLSAALAFREAGARVTVFESGRAMEQSSWAAAGMLAVDDPENDPRLLPLSRLSRALYPDFLRKIEALSGLKVPLRTDRTMQAVVRTSETWRGKHGGVQLAGLVPGRWHFDEIEEASLDPRDLCRALPLAVQAAGVVLHEQTAVAHAQLGKEAGGVVLDVSSPSAGFKKERLFADRFVVAAGAWSASILSDSASKPALPVVPRKGQMIEVRLHQNAPGLPVVIRTPELYLVPRGDGRVAVGATVEDAGFDRTLDPHAGQRLLQEAAALWPPILRSTISGEWTGLRPGYADSKSQESLPMIGSLDDAIANANSKPSGPRIWAATGHFRNGILLAPGTAHLLRAMMAGEALPVPADDFAARLQG
jgi:glycine oxidase